MKIVIAYPQAWETRPPEDIARYDAALRALVPDAVIVIAPYEESEQLRVLRGRPPYDEARRLAPQLTDAQRSAFADAEVILTLNLPFDMDRLAPKLRWVQSIGAGVAQLQSAGLEINGVTLTNAAGTASVPIAEFVLARLLEQWKLLPRYADMQRQRDWTPTYGRDLAGSTLGIVGHGAIGAAVAVRAKALGMRVLATKRTVTPGLKDAAVDRFFAFGDLTELLAEADAVVLAAPESAETLHLFDARAFAAMKEGAFFVNVARGSLVDEAALIDALSSGHLAAAAIDVASIEPLPADNPLWTAPDIRISPHSAATVARYFHAVWDLFLDNMGRYRRSEPLRNIQSSAYVG
ncbi:D-2-hydroxyacid dehydrogenase [Flavisphingomonas formosensis]|uniref:D-2-hydroxyacid dehydrogenase n=1 Tax=Flavisphingomonas formosensis TaxID=861534 RepID=UPI0012FCBE2C|nr:D-2-hydroxyacid dehydrogenase [Sphingomonas formosensis]